MKNKTEIVNWSNDLTDLPFKGFAAKEENDNFVIIVSILVGVALFLSLSVGSRSRY